MPTEQMSVANPNPSRRYRRAPRREAGGCPSRRLTVATTAPRFKCRGQVLYVCYETVPRNLFAACSGKQIAGTCVLFEAQAVRRHCRCRIMICTCFGGHYMAGCGIISLRSLPLLLQLSSRSVVYGLALRHCDALCTLLIPPVVVAWSTVSHDSARNYILGVSILGCLLNASDLIKTSFQSVRTATEAARSGQGFNITCRLCS